MTTPAPTSSSANAHPGADYYVNPITGDIQAQSNPVLAFALSNAGYQGPMTFDAAKAVASGGVGQSNPVTGAGGLTTDLNPVSWLQGLGGDIGSGIEDALVSFLKDLWAVILGPLEIIAGVALAFVIVLFMFRDDLAAVAAVVA